MNAVTTETTVDFFNEFDGFRDMMATKYGLSETDNDNLLVKAAAGYAFNAGMDKADIMMAILREIYEIENGLGCDDSDY